MSVMMCRMSTTSDSTCSGWQKTWASSWVNPLTRMSPWSTPDRSNR